MHPNAFHIQSLELAKKQAEALARIEAEQARQAEVLANIVERLDAMTADRPKRSPAKS